MIPRNDRTLHRARAARAAPRARRCRGSTATGIYWAHERLRPRLHAGSRSSALPAKKAGAGQPRPRASRTPSCARRSPRRSEIGCKRILLSNTYYPALAADNVDLVTDPIAKVTGDAVVTADGVERPVDVIVVATGFYTTELPIAEHIIGRDGRTLADAVAPTAGWRRTRARPSTASPTCS